MENNKYRLGTDLLDTKEHLGVKLNRIYAIKDFGGVLKGEMGGYIESEDNLSHEGNCWVYDDAIIMNKAKVFSDASVRGDAKVSGNAKVCGDACVSNRANIEDWATIAGKTKIKGNARVIGSCHISLDIELDSGWYITVVEKGWTIEKRDIGDGKTIYVRTDYKLPVPNNETTR